MERVEASMTFSPASGSITPILMILHKNRWWRLVGSAPLSLSSSSFMVEEGLHPKIVVHSQGLELLGQGEVREDHVMDLSRGKSVFIKRRPDLFQHTCCPDG